MDTVHDYESWGYVNLHGPRACEVLETYSGSDIVRWYGRIERQLQNFLRDAEQSRNYPTQSKLETILSIWRANPISGSINVEDIKPLEAAADILAVDNNLPLSTYFGSLRDNLRALIASEEELPRGADMNQNEPLTGGGGVSRGGPPMSPDFGPEEAPPGGEVPPEGAEGTPDGGAPGAVQPPGEGGIPEESPGDAEGEAAPEPEEVAM